MVGIVSYGAYVPCWRMSKELIRKGLAGEKAVAGSDEDSVTMGVASALDCLLGIDRSTVDAVLFASTTLPFKEKSMSTMIASALDLRRDVLSIDLAASLKAGTGAMIMATQMVKSGSARNVLVIASDCRLAPPGSALEPVLGDGAAAFLIGPEGVVAEFSGGFSISDEIYDVWRRDVDLYIQTWEDRFIYSKGYLAIVREAVEGLMKKVGLPPKEVTRAAFYSTDVRRSMELARSLGLDPSIQLQDPLIDSVGCSGTAHPLMLLASSLEDAAPASKLLVASYGSGSDALLFTVKEGIEQVRSSRRGVRKHIKRKRLLPSYTTYLVWRGLLSMPERRAPMSVSYPSASAIWRDRERIFPFYGVKCRSCGAVQYPPQRICIKCNAKDNFDKVRLSDKRGRLFSFSYDFLRGVPIGLINLEGGGRVFLELADVDIRELKVDMEMELAFRRLDLWRSDGIYGYYWKATPYFS